MGGKVVDACGRGLDGIAGGDLLAFNAGYGIRQR
jgi:hypothetical protein